MKHIISATSERDDLLIFTPRFVGFFDKRHLGIVRPELFDSVAKFQESLIELAFALRSGLRGGDFFARVSDRGFWVLLRTSEMNADVIIQRLDLGRLEGLEMYIVARKFDDHAEWIERVDQLQFNEN